MLTELRTFIAVCRLGTFQAAGDRIGLTQSAVSSQIKRLEESLGFALFERTGRAAILNPAGQATLPRAEEICALYDKLAELPGETMVAGMMRIGAIASVHATLLPRALAALRVRFAFLRIHVIPGLSISLMDALDTGQIDAAIIIKPPFGLPQDMTWQPLIREPYVLLVPNQVKGDDWRKILRENPFLRYERTSFGGRSVERFLRREGLTVCDAIELDEIAGLINLVAIGMGVALIPLAAANLPLPKKVRVVPLGEQSFHREIGVLQPNPRGAPAAASVLLECLLAASAGMPGSLANRKSLDQGSG
ncbi:LysR family transcriptional regulator [Pandoraea thiooxydans]|uniref:LysR family transcriptional regulator n=1 Tax=Pandoraea thiooxydans TaxID=445709 RepID=A0A0G3ERR1_9BURK|nr:LysR family transcriptional regulator [Pandoraea thiooxydans]AKJ69655.1 LysR family transcriptional regulator [Pandoraea thiooxydans]APR97371.1 LysR family transcriptional regulator [Pandoraea thiooxydans]